MWKFALPRSKNYTKALFSFINIPPVFIHIKWIQNQSTKGNISDVNENYEKRILRIKTVSSSRRNRFYKFSLGKQWKAFPLRRKQFGSRSMQTKVQRIFLLFFFIFHSLPMNWDEKKKKTNPPIFFLLIFKFKLIESF